MGRLRPALVAALTTAVLVACTSLGDLSGGSGASGGSSGGGDADGGANPFAAEAGCSPGFAFCPANGPRDCNTQVATDDHNCGACGSTCFGANTTAAPVCRDGRCVMACAAGFADCNGAGSDGCETDLGTDGHNCGACGHDCKGGACKDRACQPLVLTPTKLGYGPSPVAMDDAAIYFFDAQDIAVCAKTGCPQPTRLTSDGNQRTALAVDATSVYATDYALGTVRSCAKGGCNQKGTVLGPVNEPQPQGVAADGSRVFFTTITDVFHGVGKLVSCPKTGCGAAPSDVVTNLGFPRNLSVVGGKLLWQSSQGIWTCTLPGCTDAATIVAGGMGYMATDGATVYLTGYGGESILSSCALAGCNGTPTILGTLSAPIAAMAADDANLYFVEVQAIGYAWPTSRIRWCKKTACAGASTLVDLDRWVGTIAPDGAYLYWVDDGGLMRLVKP
jgi:hypothetical protein